MSSIADQLIERSKGRAKVRPKGTVDNGNPKDRFVIARRLVRNGATVREAHAIIRLASSVGERAAHNGKVRGSIPRRGTN